jgi:type IV pilus assembly protein PilP
MKQSINSMANEMNIHTQKSAPAATSAIKVLCLCLPVFLTACSSDNTSDLREYVASVKARPAGRVAPLPEITPYETYLYQVGHLRDPFSLFVAQAEKSMDINEDGLHPDLNRKREELEQYSLDTLSFVGHIEKNKKTWALITAPDGIIYRVLPGNHMGSNYGKILSITEDSILLNEIIPNGVGGWTERKASLDLSE